MYWLLRGLARSHRYGAVLKICAGPVGAGKPAKRPAPTVQTYQAARACRRGTASTSSTPNNAR
ncbi:hypothetical protein D0894_04685 [Pseudomonas monteilii]|uniref:Uncharacterized protein n=1 Tax=Pseudomonas monteilii TaxID=76759 RepID=A0A399MC58_9PSED|nr:hypothetical protein D0894_04685 [Pseudomonas monteilii]